MGLAAEARIARTLGWPVAIGGGTCAGALAVAEAVAQAGARALVSFGLAGGLDPALRPGAILLPTHIAAGTDRFVADPSLRAWFGDLPGGLLLGATHMAATAADKARLFATTGARAIDLESGAVARVAAAHGIPFAVLRAVCDPATRELPAAALAAVGENGTIHPLAVLADVLGRPRQIPGLIALAVEARAARRALVSVITAARLRRTCPCGPSLPRRSSQACEGRRASG